jgi:hypothetical protein
MPCIQCNAPTELSQKSLKPKKYCSKKCANLFLRDRYYTKKNPDWGTRGSKAKEDKERRKALLKEYERNHYTAQQVAEALGLTSGSAVWHRAEILGIEPLAVMYSGKRAFFTVEQVEQIKSAYSETPTPDGFLTKEQAAEYLGWTKSTFETMFHKLGRGTHNLGPPQRIEWQQTHGHRNTRFLYTKEDLDKWMGKLTALKEEREKAKQKLREEKQAQKQAEEEAGLQKREKEYQEKTKNLIPLNEAASTLGYKSVGPIRRKAKKLNLRLIKVSVPTEWGPRTFIKPNDLQKIKTVKEKEEQLELTRKQEFNKWKHRQDDWTSPGAYEERAARADLPNWMIENPTAYGFKAIENNEYYAEQKNRGNLTFLECKTCGEEKPHTEFYKELRITRGRSSSCKVCCKLKNSYGKNKKQTPKQKFRSLFGTTIKHNISKMRGEYATDIRIPLIWKKLEEHCGYNVQDLLDHLETQFDENMNWNNHGKPGGAVTTEDYCWQVDHIKPRSQFYYTSLDDPQFAKCWSLENLQPLSWIENITKGG